MTEGQRKQLEQRYELKLIAEFQHLNAAQYKFLLQVDAATLARDITTESIVKLAEPNYIKRINALPQDEFVGSQWSINDVGQIANGKNGPGGNDISLGEAFGIYQGNESVVVAVLDSGVALDHPDIISRIWLNNAELNGADGVDDDANGYVDDFYGWDFVDGGGIPLDENGHGTLVASQIAAAGGNNLGMVGVAPDAQIMTLRVADDFGSLGFPQTKVSRVINSTKYAVDNGAKVINASFGGSQYSSLEEQSLQWVDSQGVLFVAAAGNGGSDGLGDNNDLLPQYPASYSSSGIISVAAINRDGELSGFSNYGVGSVDIAAPGTDIFGASVTRSGLFFESFEFGAPGWTVGAVPGNQSTDDWGIWSDAFGNNWLSDSFSFATGTQFNYLPNTDTFAATPFIDLTQAVGPQLNFELYYDFQFLFDFLLIEGSVDGVNWDFLDYRTGVSIFGQVSQVNIDASRYEGSSAKFRFRLVSNSIDHRDGAYVDNVSITQVDVFQYNGNQWQFNSGTSFAAPLVSGVAALLMSARPDLTQRQVRQAILDNADILNPLSGLVATGANLNASAALVAALDMPEADPDSDGDGTPDSSDAFPDDPSEQSDRDGDGVGDNSDAFPDDPSEQSDRDGDGVGDNADAFPDNPSRQDDSDLAAPGLPIWLLLEASKNR